MTEPVTSVQLSAAYTALTQSLTIPTLSAREKLLLSLIQESRILDQKARFLRIYAAQAPTLATSSFAGNNNEDGSLISAIKEAQNHLTESAARLQLTNQITARVITAAPIALAARRTSATVAKTSLDARLAAAVHVRDALSMLASVAMTAHITARSGNDLSTIPAGSVPSLPAIGGDGGGDAADNEDHHTQTTRAQVEEALRKLHIDNKTRASLLLEMTRGLALPDDEETKQPGAGNQLVQPSSHYYSKQRMGMEELLERINVTEKQVANDDNDDGDGDGEQEEQIELLRQQWTEAEQQERKALAAYRTLKGLTGGIVLASGVDWTKHEELINVIMNMDEDILPPLDDGQNNDDDDNDNEEEEQDEEEDQESDADVSV